MKKVVFTAVVMVCLVMIMVSGAFRPIPDLLDAPSRKNTCVGYTIIEFDKGIDCNGDTIALTRRNGFAERVVNQ
ncbi:MAG TPA: hypothetical protein VFT90_09025 [Chryseosolibacter sp.]|nr:hypothetical protein [Chryseosolibacter sp.]